MTPTKNHWIGAQLRYFYFLKYEINCVYSVVSSFHNISSITNILRNRYHQKVPVKKIQKVNSESNINMPSHHRVNSSAISMSKTQMFKNNESISRYGTARNEKSLNMDRKRTNNLDMSIEK